jgi:flagellar export protein FliJ
MAKFEFRLQQVLDYRRLEEEWAKQAYLEALAKVGEVEDRVTDLRTQRQSTLTRFDGEVAERMTLELYLTRLDDQERMEMSLIAILNDDVEKARATWFVRHQEAEALQKLWDQAHAEWVQEENRREQAAMDEFGVMRRRVA